MRRYIKSFILTTSLFALLNTNSNNIKEVNNPNSYYDDYLKNNYNNLPDNNLNKNGCDNDCKINDFHHYFDEYDYYNNYSDFQYYDKKDDYYEHNYYKGSS